MWLNHRLPALIQGAQQMYSINSLGITFFYTQSPIFRGSKVIGHSSNKQFNGHVRPVLLLFLELIPSVKIWIWKLFTGPLNMRSKDPFLKRRNELASSATPKDQKDHRGELKWMIREYVPKEKQRHNIKPSQDQHSWGDSSFIVKVNNQKTPSKI